MAGSGRQQSGKRAAVEADVLRATEDLLREGGSYAELGVERIAKRAGISRTAFYFYFRDKHDLLVRLTEDANRSLVAAADSWWLGGGDLQRALEDVARIYGEHGALLRVVVEVSTYDEEIARFWRGVVGRFVAATQARLEIEQEAGAALPGHPRSLAFSLVWMTERTFYEQTVMEDPLSVPELVEALAVVWKRAVYGA